MKKILAGFMLIGLTSAFATPTSQEVQAAAQKCEQSGKTKQQCQQAAAQKAEQAKTAN